MLKNTYIKLSLFVFALFIAITVAYVKFDMFSMIGYSKSETIKADDLDQLKTEASEDNELEEADSPVYFSVFKFINSFAPEK